MKHSVLFIFIGLVAVALFAGCASAPHRSAKVIPGDHFAEISEWKIPLVMNDQVQDWMDFFQGRGRKHFERYLARSGRYIPMISQVLRQQGLPEDLACLAMIESGFNPHAYSRARAVGTWQFMYRTGLRYGLKSDNWIDERRDPQKSTVAAAKYLKDLYDRFDHWYLAAAGYNAGEGKISRAIKKYGTEDFWKVSKGKYLKAETKNYVPKLIAAALIAKNPKKYGFEKIHYENPVEYDTATIDSPTDLRVVAEAVGSTYEEIKGLNPELIRWVTPPTAASYEIKLPAGSRAKFEQKFSEISSSTRLGEKTFKVSQGGSLARVAKRLNVPVPFLALANNLSPKDSVSAGRELLIPYDPPEGERYAEVSYEGRSKRDRRGRLRSGGGGESRGGKVAYRVRRGDNLARVASRLGLAPTQLRRLNPHINWRRLIAGRKIFLATTTKKLKKAPQYAVAEEA